jgi:hypothetical protein
LHFLASGCVQPLQNNLATVKEKSMRALFFCTAIAALGLAGCSGETVSTERHDTNRKLTLNVPGKTSMAQGETETIKLSIDRDNFNDPVTVDFENLPKGITIVETNRTIPASTEAIKFTLQAARDASPVRDHGVRVKASSGGLRTEPAEFKLDVEKKD